MSGKRVKRKAPEPIPEEKPSKEEYAVAKFIRDNVPNKKTKFMHHPVQYFTAGRAVDALLDSPWASGEKKNPILFTDRQSVVDFLDTMLRHKFFHRAKKIAITDRDLRLKELKKLKKKEEEDKKKSQTKEDKKDKKEDKKEESESDSAEEEETKAEREAAAEKSNAEETAGERSAVEGETSPKAKKKKGAEAEEGKPKRRVKLDMHLEQLFVDGNDAYVWIYDPIPTHYWLLGILLVLAIVGVCLFPLWPAKVREYVYYLSLAAAGFLVFILALSVIRVVVFAVVWVVTMGRHHLWVLPNLTEDVGFFASFWPLYQYEYKGPKEDKKKEKRKKKKDGVEGEGGEAASKPAEAAEAAEGAPEEAAEGAPEEGAATGDGEERNREHGAEEQRDSEDGSQASQQSTGSFEILDKTEEPGA